MSKHIDKAHYGINRIIPLTFWYASHLRSKGVEVDQDHPLDVLVFDCPQAEDNGTTLIYNGLLRVTYYRESIADSPVSVFKGKTIIDWQALHVEDSDNMRTLVAECERIKRKSDEP